MLFGNKKLKRKYILSGLAFIEVIERRIHMKNRNNVFDV